MSISADLLRKISVGLQPLTLLPSRCTGGLCFKYTCPKSGSCQNYDCSCSSDSDCSGAKSGSTSTPYCVSGSCNELSSGEIAGIVISIVVVCMIIAGVAAAMRRQQRTNDSVYIAFAQTATPVYAQEQPAYQPTYQPAYQPAPSQPAYTQPAFPQPVYSQQPTFSQSAYSKPR